MSEERKGGLKFEANYTFDANSPLANVLSDGTLTYVHGLAYAFDASGTLQVYHTDGLGLIRAITDGSGNLLETYQYDGFGNSTGTVGPSTQPLRFTGQQLDTETKLYDLRARMYDPVTGRFFSRDPLGGSVGQPQSLNPYAYAGNNPGTMTDPSGQEGDCNVLGNTNLDQTPCSNGFLGAGAGANGGGTGVNGDGVTIPSPGEIAQNAERWVQARLPGLDNEASPSVQTTFSVAASSQQSIADYRETFFSAYPELRGKVVVHHAVEQQVLSDFPGRFSEGEIHSLENLRGIPLSQNGRLHLSQIRLAWNSFYRSVANPTRGEILQRAAEIDARFGSEFLPPR